jgi:hypothetical protein
METKMKSTSLMSALVIAASLFASGTAFASSIDNLERERAMALAEYLSPDMGADERWSQLERAKRRLTDLERIALQDKTLKKTGSFRAVRAFKDYERTFLVHASAEFNKNPIIHWMDNIGLTSTNLLATRAVK